MTHQSPPSRKALVVDDSIIARRIARRVLGERKVVSHVHEAEDGAGALKSLERHDIDILLLDIDMPGLNGLDLLKEMQKNPLNSKPYTVMVTCLSDSQTVREAMNSGADDYVIKPYDKETLLAKIDRYLCR